MSATTLQGGPAMTLPNNGAVRAKAGRKAGAKSKAKRPAAPLQAGQLPGTGTTGAAAQTNVAARRIGLVTIPATIPAGTFATTGGGGSLAWLYERQRELEIEGRLIRSMIASFGPRRIAATGAPKKSKRRAKKRAAPAKAAAAA